MNIYADDAALISSSRWDNISSMNNNIQKDLEIQQWVIMNKMIINEKKTKSSLEARD